ncbi:MAG: ankyrin repeat domain-containing protein [Erythrobacter sp.]|nr:ankyrin repeat domain-containing protein [Erythrobacter sp.]
MRIVVGLAIVAVILAVAMAVWAQWNGSRKTPMQFSGQDAVLEEAIAADDAAAVNAALAGGANANARGALGVTPLAFAVGTGRKSAARALIAAGANPNLEDDDGDTAVTLAVNRYGAEPEFLPMVLDAGGNPNQLRPDGDPVIVRFINGADLDAITLMHDKGADMSAIANQQPLVVFAAYGTDWDVVWHLITLGADLTDPKAREGLVEAFKVPRATLPDSPLYPAKVKVYQHLRELGEDPVPPAEYEESL